MIASAGLVVLLTVLTLEWVRRRRQHWRYFIDRNIPGPPAHFLWGHYHLLSLNHGYWYQKWFEEYGDTYGVFWGVEPVLVSCDLDLQQRVLIKEFSNFVNRAPLFKLEKAHPINSRMLIHEEGSRWKGLRSVITPAFSSGNMRRMSASVLKSVEQLESNIRKKQAAQFDIYLLLREMTMDIICRTAFGVHATAESGSGRNPPLILAAQEMFDFVLSSSLDRLLNSSELVRRFLGSILFYLFKYNLIKHSSTRIIEESKRIVQFRRSAPERNDLMQTLLNSNTVSTDERAFMASDGSGDQSSEAKISSNGTKKTVTLSNDDVIANSTLMLLAGYETTSTALAFTIHCLAKHPDIQKRLRQEILEAISEDEELESFYNKATSLKYLDQCIRESFRLYPPVTGFTSRCAANTFEHNGLKLEPGLNIKFPTRVIHTDPRNFVDPLTFNPERFSEKPRHPLAYQPFGDGPRNCAGMRLALMSMKFTLCHLLRKFDFFTDHNIKLASKGLITQPVQVKVEVKAI